MIVNGDTLVGLPRNVQITAVSQEKNISSDFVHFSDVVRHPASVLKTYSIKSVLKETSCVEKKPIKGKGSFALNSSLSLGESRRWVSIQWMISSSSMTNN